MEFAQISKEREQQATLALEDAELQKTAVRTEADNKIKEMQLELETAKTVSFLTCETRFLTMYFTASKNKFKTCALIS